MTNQLEYKDNAEMSYAIEKYFLLNIRKIIEENTDIYSIFHYQETELIKEIDNVSYYVVKEIFTNKKSIVNSNREFLLPFDYYEKLEISEDDKFILCQYNNETILFVLEKNFGQGIFNKRKPSDIPYWAIRDNKYINLAKIFINVVENSNSDNYTNLKCTIKRYKDIFKTIKENTKIMEETKIKHSIFDYGYTKFFTNNHNKIYFCLQDKTTKKRGLVNAKGELIVPLIYDDCSYQFCFCNNEFILTKNKDKWGLLDNLGNLVLEPLAEEHLKQCLMLLNKIKN